LSLPLCRAFLLRGGLLTPFPCSSVRSLSWETVLHKLLQRESFPQAAALHELPQHGSFPWDAVLQAQAAPAWVPHGVTSRASKPAPAWATVSPQGHRSWQEPAPAWGSPQGHSFLSLGILAPERSPNEQP